MKAVKEKDHAKENGRNPFPSTSLKQVLNNGYGWLIEDGFHNNYIRYYDGFAIAFEEYSNHFEIITVYPVNPEKFYNNARFEIVEK